MRTKLVWFLIQVAPVVASVMGMATFSVCATEISSSPESDRSPATAASTRALLAASIELSPHLQVGQVEPVTLELTDNVIVSELMVQPSDATSSISVEQTERTYKATDIFIQNEANTETNTEWQISSTGTPNVDFLTRNNEAESNRLSKMPTPNSAQSLLLESLISNRGEDLLDENEPARLPVPDTTEEVLATASFSTTEIQLIPIAPSEMEQPLPERWQIAQTQPSPELEVPEDAPEATPELEETLPASRWHVTITPYGFVPLSVDGSATVRDFTADFDLGLDDILDPLNFAAAGRVEAWRGNLGFVFDGAYFNVGQENSRSLSIPNCLCDIFPSEIETDVNVQYGQFDLGVGYRVAANLSNAATEFEMGPLVFDAIVGMRIYALHQEIDISTNVGTDRNLENSNTIVTPLVSGRLRWNVSPTLAGWVRGDFAGFGIGGTLMAASVTGGLDWMFSGNTSLLLAYRISSLQYSTDVRGEDFDLDLLMQGPYMGIVFRF